MEYQSICSIRGMLAAWLAGCALCSGAVEVAGELLVDLDAADFSPGAGKWPQHTTGTGIAGDFMSKGSPTRQVVGGAEAVVFDGDGDYFLGPFTTAALHAPGANHSVEVWVFQGNVRDQESVVSWGKRWGRPDLSFAGFRYGSDPEFGAISRWGSSESAFSEVPPPGKWHHIVYTYDGKTQAVYVDGKLDNAKPVGLLDAHDMLPIHLGAEICGDLKIEGQFTHYSGALAKVRIHSRALNPDQVKRNYDAELPGYPGLVAKVLQQSPMHRFSFNSPAGPATDGTTVVDSIGGLTAEVRGANAEFTGTAVRLPGGSSATAAYLDFPNGLISSRENVTIEFWETQIDEQVWSRILSIGTNQAGEITGPGGSFIGSETLTLFGNVGATRVNRFARSYGTFPNGGPDRNPADYPESDYGVEFHQVITYDKHLKEWHWYRNGILMEVIADEEGPATIDDVNVWLGRSEFSSDNNFRGLINEFRVYNHALGEGEIYGNYKAGPDTLNLAGQALASSWVPADPGSYTFANRGGTNNWNTGTDGPHPDGPGSIATFATFLTNDQNITLDSAITLGSLNLGSRGPRGAFIIDGGNTASITMDSGNGIAASITQLPNSPHNFIKVPVILHSATEIANQSSEPLVIEGPVRGGGEIVKTGSGPVVLTGDCGQYAGQVKIVAGDLVINNPSLLPASGFTINDPGRLVLDHGRDITLNGVFKGSGSISHQGSGNLILGKDAALDTGGSITMDNGAGTFISEGAIDGPDEIRSDSNVLLRGHGVTRLRNWLSIGKTNGGTLTVSDSALVEIRGEGHLNIGDIGIGQSTMFVNGGSISCNELFVGKNTGTSGVIIQTGGNLKKNGMRDSRLGGGRPDAWQVWGGWRMTGGSFTDEGDFQIGTHGIGVMEIDGGKAEVAGFLGIGRYEDDANHPSHGVLDVKSGSVSTTGQDKLLLVGEEGIGVLNIRGGEVVCANRMIIGAGTISKPGDGTVNLLAGGTLTTGGIGQFNQSEATGRLNLDGGTLRVAKSGDAFLEGLDAAYVGKGGARIDTNGFDAKIRQDLLEPQGRGVRSIPVSNGGGGFLCAPWIDINGGGGSGATAIAELVNGSIKSITITHPGNGYDSVPAIGILGGGSGTGLKLGTPVLAENSGGGLTKTGSGTLTLGGSNSYTGTTLVEQGGLRVEGKLTGPVKVSGNATLGGNGLIEASVEVAGDSTISPDPGSPLRIRRNLAVRGVFLARIMDTDAGRAEVGGTLDLTGAKLVVKSNGTHPDKPVRLIASYGTLRGQFAEIESLPAGYAIDYHYNRLNQIALVATVAASDGD